MSSLPILDSGELRAEGRVIAGLVVAKVTNNQDPDKLGRVKLTFPWLSETVESAWARVASPFTGNGFGWFCLPEVGDDVLVMFERGDVDRPFVVGSLWNAATLPPADNADGKNNLRLFKSRSGHVFSFDDTENSERIAIRDKSGKNEIVIDSASNSISIQADGDLTVTVQGNIAFQANGDISLACRNFTLEAQSKAAIGASQELGLTCSPGVRINNDGLVVT